MSSSWWVPLQGRTPLDLKRTNLFSNLKLVFIKLVKNFEISNFFFQNGGDAKKKVFNLFKNKQQHGFKKGKETATAGLILQSLITRALDDGYFVAMISIDLVR